MLLEQQERRGNLQQTEFTFYTCEEWSNQDPIWQRPSCCVSSWQKREGKENM